MKSLQILNRNINLQQSSTSNFKMTDPRNNSESNDSSTSSRGLKNLFYLCILLLNVMLMLEMFKHRNTIALWCSSATILEMLDSINVKLVKKFHYWCSLKRPV